MNLEQKKRMVMMITADNYYLCLLFQILFQTTDTY